MTTKADLSLKSYSYDFPDELIARTPADKRDQSRLLVVHKNSGKLEHKTFSDIVDYFNAGDVLIMNTSKVFPCRLITKRATGGRQEILLIHPLNDIDNNTQDWKVLINASKKVKQGDSFSFDGLELTIISSEGNERTARLTFKNDLIDTLEKIASIPLPPYMNRDAEESDKLRYQTVFADETGSVAAPTAGLHFTPGILEALKSKGVLLGTVTLHVGPGTFLPVRTDNLEDHEMHSEWYRIDEHTCNLINAAKRDGRRVFAIGTTSTRVLETIGQKDGDLKPESGWTNIFIYPGFEFKIVDHLITNFHLPESTLLMLVSAFYNREKMLDVYNEAVADGYRLFSYGDSMLIL